MKKWEKLLNRGSHLKMSMFTKVSLNHFAAGHCSSECRIPTLFMEGHDFVSAVKDYHPKKDYHKLKVFSNLKNVGKFIGAGQEKMTITLNVL